MAGTILYVDDERDNLEAFARTFAGSDFVDAVLTATSGEEALRLLREREVSVVVTDQRMPGMSGTELLGRVLSEFPDTVRVILTAYTDVTEVIDAINQGRVFFFITKPWEPDALRLVIRRAVEHHATLRELRSKNRELADAYARLEQAHRDQARSFEMVISDEKTGIRNAHYFRIRLGEEFERARRFGHELGLLLVDVDGFRKVNQAHGELVGDATLREIAQLLVEVQRSIDVVARWGGEEFGVILPETGERGAVAMAARLRDRIASHDFLGADGQPFRLSVSCGVAALPDPDLVTKEDLISRAERALARAKGLASEG